MLNLEIHDLDSPVTDTLVLYKLGGKNYSERLVKSVLELSLSDRGQAKLKELEEFGKV